MLIFSQIAVRESCYMYGCVRYGMHTRMYVHSADTTLHGILSLWHVHVHCICTSMNIQAGLDCILPNIGIGYRVINHCRFACD